MKSLMIANGYPLYLLGVLCFVACANPSEEKEIPYSPINSDAPPNEIIQEIDQQILLHGVDILYAYYHTGTLSKEAVNDSLSIMLEADVYDQLHSDNPEQTIRSLRGQLVDTWSELSVSQQEKSLDKAMLWLAVFRVVNDQFCAVSIEAFLAEAYEIAEFRVLVDQLINPSIGQYVGSLSSAQIDQVMIGIWNTLAELDKQRRLEIMAEMLDRCSSIQE